LFLGNFYYLHPVMKKLLSVLVLILAGLTVFSQGIDKPRYQILTKRAGNYLGTFNIELFPLVAPNHVHNFDSLALALAFDSTAFHRVVPGFVIQGGDPNSINGPVSTWGQGNPNQPTVNAEFSPVRHLRGIIGAARDADTNSANSQFYVCVANATFLDGQYTVFGRVTEGMDVVDTIVASPRDANDVPLQKIEMFVTYIGVNDTIPNAPSTTLPANNATGILPTQSYQWSSVPEAILYTVEFSTDSLFSTIYYSKRTALTYIQSPTFLGYTKYYWRVRSNNGGHESLNSTVSNFTTIAGAPNLVFPPDSSIQITDPVNFLWDASAGAASYQFQVATATSFSGVYLIHNLSNVTGTSQLISGLNPNTRYYWRMRSTDGTAFGPWSPKYTFVTMPLVGIAELNADAYQLEALYPNPASDIINLKFTTTSAEKITVTISDISGKVVFSDMLNVSTSGKQNCSISINTFAKGNYILTMSNNGKISSHSFKKD
jgi:peptidyl-prolyl cis-trans isomerase B (cyclophilin B)